jgi:hypothetical protein
MGIGRGQGGGRLTKEEQQLRPGDHFNSDGQPLALLDVQPLAGHAHNGVRVRRHLEQLQHVVDILQLFPV